MLVGMRITFFGTTTLLADDGRDQLFFDCHVTRPSLKTLLFGKLITDEVTARRLVKDCDIHRLRGIFVSHTHHDHVMDAPYFARQCHAAVYGSSSALMVARGGGVTEDALHDYAEKADYGIGDYQITVLPSLHSKPFWFNNDLGQTIDAPLYQPAKKRAYKEGGSFDFLVRHNDTTLLIRPSYNYLPGALAGIHADTLFLGITGLSNDSKADRERFFAETIDRVRPSLVVPLHWDWFFSPLSAPVRGMPPAIENTKQSLTLLSDACRERGIRFRLLLPLHTIEICYR